MQNLLRTQNRVVASHKERRNKYVVGIRLASISSVLAKCFTILFWTLFLYFPYSAGPNLWRKKEEMKSRFYLIAGSPCVTEGKNHRESGRVFVNPGHSQNLAVWNQWIWRCPRKIYRLMYPGFTSFPRSPSWTLPCHFNLQI